MIVYREVSRLQNHYWLTNLVIDCGSSVVYYQHARCGHYNNRNSVCFTFPSGPGNMYYWYLLIQFKIDWQDIENNEWKWKRGSFSQSVDTGYVSSGTCFLSFTRKQSSPIIYHRGVSRATKTCQFTVHDYYNVLSVLFYQNNKAIHYHRFTHLL